MKTCRDCHLNKDQSEFIKNKAFKDGVDTLCTLCNRLRVKVWRKKNPDKRKEQLKRESGKDYNHNKHLKATYGITHAEYTKMFEEQEGCCAICKRHQLEFKRRLSVDHCHATNVIRKLLCQNCNNILGDARDNPDVLKQAIEYLNEFKDVA